MKPEEEMQLALHSVHSGISHLRACYKSHPVELMLERFWLNQLKIDLDELHAKIEKGPPTDEVEGPKLETIHDRSGAS